VGRAVIIGNGGHARACIDAWDTTSAIVPVGYVGPAAGDVLGLSYLGTDDDLPTLFASGITHAFVALGSNRVRAAVSARCVDAGLTLATLVAPTAQIGATASLGPGTAVLHRAVLGARATVGTCSIINTGATVDHDCVIGDYVHVAPGVNLAGTVVVGDRAMIGIGASIIPGVRIGADATVGAGAVVLHDVPDGQTVVGVPAQELKR
jgi:sugar O-acyltransferase (sialic acid O-acetyltransferase NeuD family)